MEWSHLPYAQKIPGRYKPWCFLLVLLEHTGKSDGIFPLCRTVSLVCSLSLICLVGELHCKAFLPPALT